MVHSCWLKSTPLLLSYGMLAWHAELSKSTFRSMLCTMQSLLGEQDQHVHATCSLSGACLHGGMNLQLTQWPRWRRSLGIK